MKLAIKKMPDIIMNRLLSGVHRRFRNATKLTVEEFVEMYKVIKDERIKGQIFRYSNAEPPRGLIVVSESMEQHEASLPLDCVEVGMFMDVIYVEKTTNPKGNFGEDHIIPTQFGKCVGKGRPHLCIRKFPKHCILIPCTTRAGKCFNDIDLDLIPEFIPFLNPGAGSNSNFDPANYPGLQVEYIISQPFESTCLLHVAKARAENYSSGMTPRAMLGPSETVRVVALYEAMHHTVTATGDVFTNAQVGEPRSGFYDFNAHLREPEQEHRSLRYQGCVADDHREETSGWDEGYHSLKQQNSMEEDLVMVAQDGVDQGGLRADLYKFDAARDYDPEALLDYSSTDSDHEDDEELDEAYGFQKAEKAEKMRDTTVNAEGRDGVSIFGTRLHAANIFGTGPSALPPPTGQAFTPLPGQGAIPPAGQGVRPPTKETPKATPPKLDPYDRLNELRYQSAAQSDAIEKRAKQLERLRYDSDETWRKSYSKDDPFHEKVSMEETFKAAGLAREAHALREDWDDITLKARHATLGYVAKPQNPVLQRQHEAHFEALHEELVGRFETARIRSTAMGIDQHGRLSELVQAPSAIHVDS
jgi:hypothetical protein